MLLHSINDNIIIYHPSYSVVYQNEAKNDISTKRWDSIFGLEPNQK